MTVKNNESGRTMLEMLGVLAIMGVIMLGAISGIGFGIEMYKINATRNEIEEISSGIVDLYSWSRDYSGLDNNGAQIICENDITTACTSANPPSLKSKWSGDIRVASKEGGKKFTITYVGLDELPCGRLITGPSFTHGTLTLQGAAGGAASCAATGNNLIFTSF